MGWYITQGCCDIQLSFIKTLHQDTTYCHTLNTEMYVQCSWKICNIYIVSGLIVAICHDQAIPTELISSAEQIYSVFHPIKLLAFDSSGCWGTVRDLLLWFGCLQPFNLCMQSVSGPAISVTAAGSVAWSKTGAWVLATYWARFCWHAFVGKARPRKLEMKGWILTLREARLHYILPWT